MIFIKVGDAPWRNCFMNQNEIEFRLPNYIVITLILWVKNFADH